MIKEHFMQEQFEAGLKAFDDAVGVGQPGHENHRNIDQFWFGF